jgi:hypothetical protein
MVDEGAYLFLGYLFAQGEYRPFRITAGRTTCLFSFLVPGFVQTLFSPESAPALPGDHPGLLALLGLWLVARRLGGWWAAAAVCW